MRCEMALREVSLISDRPESTVYPEEPYRLSVTSLVGLRCVPDASRGFLTELDLSKVPGPVRRPNEYAGGFEPGLNNLSRVHMPSSLTTIGRWAFSESGVQEIDLRGTVVQSMAEWVFRGCKRLQVVHLPGTVEEILAFVFMETGIVRLELSHCMKLRLLGIGGISVNPQLKIVTLPRHEIGMGSFGVACCEGLGELDVGRTRAIQERDIDMDVWRVLAKVRDDDWRTSPSERMTLRTAETHGVLSSLLGVLGRAAAKFSGAAGSEGGSFRPLCPAG